MTSPLIHSGACIPRAICSDTGFPVGEAVSAVRLETGNFQGNRPPVLICRVQYQSASELYSSRVRCGNAMSRPLSHGGCGRRSLAPLLPRYLAVRPLFPRDWILFRGPNLFGLTKAARSLFRALYQPSKQTSRVFTVLFRPSLRWLLLHGPNHGASDVAKIREPRGVFRNVVR